jgi:predicted nucleic acid-binding protein
VFDSSSLIKLERSHELRHLPSPGNFLVVPSRVAKEVSRKGAPEATIKWLKRGSVADFVAGSEGQLFMRLRQQETLLSDPDIQGIVIAHHRRGTYVVEERAARRVAERLGVKCLNAQEFLQEFGSKYSVSPDGKVQLRLV